MFFVKNVYKLPNGNWQFEIVVKGKRFRRNFSSKNDAVAYANSFKSARKFELSFFASLSTAQIDDLRSALDLLPSGLTLTRIVKKYLEQNLPVSVDSFVADFIAIKEAKHLSENLCAVELRQIKSRLNALKSEFPTFETITPESILAFLKSRGKNKTVSNWRGTINEFFNYCVRKNAIKQNPLSLILKDEFLKAEEKFEIEILSLDDAKTFFSIVEEKYPRIAKFYALAMFAGIRVAEIPRLKDEYFRYDEKKIIFPAQIGKVKKSWVLEDLPDNLWAWLEKYKNAPIVAPSEWTRRFGFKPLKLPHNFARHSFATYHISLFFDFAKTARITRNSEQMLKQHYLSMLVDKATAKAYFEIFPK